ncbi:MAG: dihydroorotate dehydrogenase [Fibrobacteres bacterium]|nr:dihydroorotate dehydrogenase [Fibrobacterota bacterium]
MELKVKIGKTVLNNPVCVASGTFGYAHEMSSVIDIKKIGAVFTKAITKEPRVGNPPPRIVETPAGMLNAIGLANVGVDVFIKEKLPFLAKMKPACFVNVAGTVADDYEHVIRKLDEHEGVDGYEINLSCPNVKKGGISFSSHPDETAAIVKQLRKATKRTMIIKLSPNVTDIAAYAKAAENEGADAISLINTLIGMSIDVNKRKPRLTNVTGGLSGPAIRPVGVAMTWKAAKAVSIPIIGMGGIVNARDALEYILAGASAIQIGTGNFVEPETALKVLNGITEYMKQNKLKELKDIIGKVQTA